MNAFVFAMDITVAVPLLRVEFGHVGCEEPAVASAAAAQHAFGLLLCLVLCLLLISNNGRIWSVSLNL